MGGGNGAKSKQARERAEKNAKKGPTTNLGTNKERLRCSCFKIFTPQQMNGKGGMLEHLTEKHAGQTLEKVFTAVKEG